MTDNQEINRQNVYDENEEFNDHELWTRSVIEANYINSLIDNKDILYITPYIRRTIYININGITSINIINVNNVDDSRVEIYYTDTNYIINKDSINNIKYSYYSIYGENNANSILDFYLF